VNKGSIVLSNLMTMEYVRVRKDTLQELKGVLEKRQKPDWHLIAAIVGMVVVVAVTGLVLAL
jgi:hypothetical protein